MLNKLDIDRQRWLAASPFLEQALDLPEPLRSAWLQQLETQSPEIAADVAQLLAAETADAFRSFLNVPSAATPAGTAPFPQLGESIGNYRVVEEVGRGGMAVVYLAERADGLFHQRVALKVLRFGAVANLGRRHFAQERQILASLNHPGIARLIDGGVTHTGMPYLTMEYVRGVTLDRHCDNNKLSLEERLRMFVQVAEAVHYAHRHLIVHRDLKPSNIVVDAEGAVKLLDFGIAKLLSADTLPNGAPATRDIGTLMTPEYASPEQARGEPVTTATDVYQLGLLLYELLTGRAPYELNNRSAVETLRIICEVDPVPPSAAVIQAPAGDSVAADRATTPSRLSRTLRGDLDAIVLMALRKEPERRYSSVASLRDDILRYLRGQPVSAYKGIWLYRTGKFVRRHAVSVAISAISACALAAVVVWYTVQLAHERDNAAMEASRARQEAAFALQISEFLTRVFRGSNSRVAQSDTTARELLERGAARIETELAGQPALQGRLLTVIGDTYAQYELNDKAQPLLDRALLQNTRLFGANSNEAADSKQGLARIARNRGEMAKARQLLQEVLVVREQTRGPRHITSADALHELAYIHYRLGEAKEAVQSAERAIEIYGESLPENDERILSAMNNHALSLSNAGEYARARAQFEDLVPRMERTLGPNDPRLASALSNLANMRIDQDDYAGVESLMLRAAAIEERLYGPHHTNLTISRLNLASLYYDLGRFGDAIPVLEQIISNQPRNSGSQQELQGAAHNQLARLLHARGELKEAVAPHSAALDIYRVAIGTSHWRYGQALREYGELQMDLGALRPAEVSLGEALNIARDDPEAEQVHIAAALVSLGQLYARTNEGSRCESLVREALDLYRNIFPEGNLLIDVAKGTLGECLLAQHKLPDAEPLLRDSIEQLGDRHCIQRRQFFASLLKLYNFNNDSSSARDTQTRLLAFSGKLRSQ